MPTPALALLVAGALTAAAVILFWPERGLLLKWSDAMRKTERVMLEDALAEAIEAGAASDAVVARAEILEAFRGQVAARADRLTEQLPASVHQLDALYDEVVNGANSSLARYEQIKKTLVLPTALSIEGGQLTPTLKVKRRVVEQQFTNLVDGLYEG